MKVSLKVVLLLLPLAVLSQCERDEVDPNENWVIGADWFDTRDGHPYSTVPIGDQIWLADNLAYLPSVNKIADGSEDEGKEKEAFYYVYGYDGTDVSTAKATSNYKDFGILYNWTAASKACPVGWHLPSDEEWKELEIYLGMSIEEAYSAGYRGTNEGVKLKATWSWEYVVRGDKYGNGTNETGFTALPCGDRYQTYQEPDYAINGSGYWGAWWSATQVTGDGETFLWSRLLYYSLDKVYRSQRLKSEALSVRCLKN